MIIKTQFEVLERFYDERIKFGKERSVANCYPWQDES